MLKLMIFISFKFNISDKHITLNSTITIKTVSYNFI